jgi:hypothetical protein
MQKRDVAPKFSWRERASRPMFCAPFILSVSLVVYFPCAIVAQSGAAVRATHSSASAHGLAHSLITNIRFTCLERRFVMRAVFLIDSYAGAAWRFTAHLSTGLGLPESQMSTVAIR